MTDLNTVHSLIRLKNVLRYSYDVARKVDKNNPDDWKYLAIRQTIFNALQEVDRQLNEIRRIDNNAR